MLDLEQLDASVIDFTDDAVTIIQASQHIITKGGVIKVSRWIDRLTGHKPAA